MYLRPSVVQEQNCLVHAILACMQLTLVYTHAETDAIKQHVQSVSCTCAGLFACHLPCLWHALANAQVSETVLYWQPPSVSKQVLW